MSMNSHNNLIIQSGLCKKPTKPREVCYSNRGSKIFGFRNKLNNFLMQMRQNLEPTDQRIAMAVRSASQKYGVPEKLICAVIKQESDFNPKATSHCNAQGLMQLMPATAKEMGVKDSYNIEQNIDGGTKYLSQMLETFGGNTKFALAAYNAGPGAVTKHKGIPPYKETQNYVHRIMTSLDRGDVGIPNGLPKPESAPTRNPEAQVLVAKYQTVDQLVGPKQVKYHENTEMGAAIAASENALANSVTESIANTHSIIEENNDSYKGKKQGKRPLPPNAILV